MKARPDYSWAELMTVVIARDLRDGELGHAGGARNEIPVAAVLLARKMHAPNLMFLPTHFGFNPRPLALQLSGPDYRHLRGVEAFGTFYDVFELGENGRLGFFCYSGMQIDQYGNINLHFIGDPKKPLVRGPGLVNPTWASTASRFYLYPVEHMTRNMVEKVDYISAAGFLDGGDSRVRLGFKGGGPCLCVTPLCVFDFEPQSKRMRIKSVHEWVTLEEVLQNTGFRPIIPDHIPTTAPPTQEELDILRNEVDTQGLLRR